MIDDKRLEETTRIDRKLAQLLLERNSKPVVQPSVPLINRPAPKVDQQQQIGRAHV